MTEILLVRHGQTSWNRQRRYLGWHDIELDEIGRQQARSLANRLAAWPIEAIYTSDLQRAAKTAAAIGYVIGLTAKPEPRLRELDFGSIEGLTFEEAQARYPDGMVSWLSDADRPPPGVEPYGIFRSRIASFMVDVQKTHPDETVLIVTHGGPIREILRQSLGLPPEGFWYFKIDLASLSAITLYRSGPIVSRLNDVFHLEVTTNDS